MHDGVDFDFEVILRTLKKCRGRACATRRSRSRSAAGSQCGRAAVRRPSTTSTSSSSPRTRSARSRRSWPPGSSPRRRRRAGCSRRGTATSLVDLIFEPRGGPIDDDWLERADELDVYAVTMRVASLDDVLVTKLLALSEQNLDYSSVLEMARAIGARLGRDPAPRRARRTRRRSVLVESSTSRLPLAALALAQRAPVPSPGLGPWLFGTVLHVRSPREARARRNERQTDTTLVQDSGHVSPADVSASFSARRRTAARPPTTCPRSSGCGGRPRSRRRARGAACRPPT